MDDIEFVDGLMAYTTKSGSFSLFKNDRKAKDSHPDYTGSGMDLDGN